MLLLFLAGALFLPASEEPGAKVYFPPDTPWLEDIAGILVEQRYVLSPDSASAEFSGELLCYAEGDSLRCDIVLRDEKNVTFVPGSFMKEPAGRGNVRRALRNFSITLLILNALTAILFVVRSS